MNVWKLARPRSAGPALKTPHRTTDSLGLKKKQNFLFSDQHLTGNKLHAQFSSGLKCFRGSTAGDTDQQSVSRSSPAPREVSCWRSFGLITDGEQCHMESSDHSEPFIIMNSGFTEPLPLHPPHPVTLTLHSPHPHPPPLLNVRTRLVTAPLGLWGELLLSRVM